MDRETLRRKALFAAGSVVLAAGLAACPTATPGDTAAADTAAVDADTALADTADDKPDCTGVDMGDPEAYAACCDGLAAWCADAHPGDEEAATACTYGPDYDGSTGCIPWGPPVPPRFRGAVA